MESQRQKKISSLIKKEVAELISLDLRKGGIKNLIISVTQARVSPDLSLCKVYLSIFGANDSDIVFENIMNNSSTIRYEVGKILRHQLRKTPLFQFYIDDSFDYSKKIDALLNG